MLVCPPTPSLHVFENIQMLLCLPITSRLHENIKMQICPLPTRRDESQQIAAFQLRGPTTTRCFCTQSEVSVKTNPLSEGMFLNRSVRGNCSTEYNHTFRRKASLPMAEKSPVLPGITGRGCTGMPAASVEMCQTLY